MAPNCSPPAFSSGTPLIVFGDEASMVVSGVIFPLSSAAVAVTTLKVEPGGYSSCVARLSSGWFGGRCSAGRSATGSGSGRTPGSTPSRAPCRWTARSPRPRPCGPPGRSPPPRVPFRSRFVTTSLPSRSRLSSRDRIVANSFSLPDQLLVARLARGRAGRSSDERVADRMGEQAALRVDARVACGSRRARGRGCVASTVRRRRRGSGRAGSSAPRSAAAGWPGCPSSDARPRTRSSAR